MGNKYIKRQIEDTLDKYVNNFPVVLITGPRQVGKSTMCKNKFANAKYISLDNTFVLSQLKNDALGYLESVGNPIILDEIQRVPESFLTIKYIVDANKSSGMYILTGSQKYELMKGVSESLAGRVGIVNMLGLSNREIFSDNFNIPFIPTTEFFSNRNTKVDYNKNLWKYIHRGSMPELTEKPEMDWEMFYSSYVSTYIDKDVNNHITNKLTFTKFMIALASRTSQMLNISSIANDVGIDQKTAKNWLSILEASNIIYFLQPFSLNINKRIVKTPKLYFTDTGLVCYLCRWLNPEVLENGAMAGAIYETYIISEILKSYYNSGKNPNMFYFRNNDGQEVDLLFFQNETLYPIEIKKTSSPNIKDIKHFNVLKTYFPTLNIGEGGVICNYKELEYLDKNNRVIPVNYI